MKKIRYIDKVKLPVVRPCPCAVGHISCGYIIISHILGCPYDCKYCFLRTFYGKDEIVIYNNEEDILAQLTDHMAAAPQPLRYGTGQYSDSLALDQMIGFSEKLIQLFARQDRHLLELKTKSAAVDHLLDLDHKGRTVFAWSVNPEKITGTEEIGTEGPGTRIGAAKRCVAAGYPVGFHFDPIIHYPGWEKDYTEVVKLIFDNIHKDRIAWISLGALRYKKERYSELKRIEIFRQMNSFIRSHSRAVYIYLCMESEHVWEQAKIFNPSENPFSKYFNFFKLT